MKAICKCDGCDGSGVRVPATPLCRFDKVPKGWVIVERCDVCEKYPSDYQACKAFFELLRIIPCDSGSNHVLGRYRKKKEGKL